MKKRLKDKAKVQKKNETEINEILNILNKPLIYNMPKKRFISNKMDKKHISMIGRVFHDSVVKYWFINKLWNSVLKLNDQKIFITQWNNHKFIIVYIFIFT